MEDGMLVEAEAMWSEHIENNPHIGVRFRRFQDREHVNKQLKKLQNH